MITGRVVRVVGAVAAARLCDQYLFCMVFGDDMLLFWLFDHMAALTLFLQARFFPAIF